MHDSEGWKSLETSMRNLQHAIEAIGTSLYKFDLGKILEVIERAIAHLNRFVREISYFVINAIFEASVGVDKTPNYGRFEDFADKLVPLVAKGLSDNWSQVRYASSLCCRSFYLVAKGCQEQNLAIFEKYNAELVPRMCLNRYYVAEGVRRYSIETWKQVFGEQGKQVVVKYATAVCQYYISQSQADNHAVREAACHCIGELCTKVVSQGEPEEAKNALREHIRPLLDTLVDCFKDESWPVRDSACIACGSFVATFPEESEPKFEELCQLWIAHLSDNIFSVRQNSAVALAKVYEGASMYRPILFERFEKYIREHIYKAKTDQAEKSETLKSLTNETQFGVAKDKPHVQNADDLMHENNQMYSCGSLAPKLKRGGGCMDHGFQRAQEPWEMSDGCIFLIQELSKTRIIAGEGGKSASVDMQVVKMF